MRSIRWKNQYTQRDPEINRRNKRLVGCFNQLMEAAEKKEHCQEMEQFLTEVGAELEADLQQHQVDAKLANDVFFTRMVKALPLQPYGSPACRQCGLCDTAQAKIAEHLQDPINCLQHPDYKTT